MNNPHIWDKLLAEAPQGSVLMGGAVIDYIANQYLISDIDPKDYDIFHIYQVGLPPTPPNWVFQEVDYNDPTKKAQHDEDYLQAFGEDGFKIPNPISSVYNYIVDGNKKVQLIGLNIPDPKQHFKTFDHSLTLGMYSSNGMFVSQRVFESLRTKTIYYLKGNKEKAWERMKRKINRYGGNWIVKGFD